MLEPPREPDLRALLPDGAVGILIARPRELFGSDSSALVIHALAPDERLEAFRLQHGVDLRTLDRLAWASYESTGAQGDIVIAQGPFRAEVAVAELAHRMIPRESQEETPRARAGGVFHGTRIDAIALGPHTLALVIGSPTLTARLIRTADGLSPPAIAGPIEQTLRRYTDPIVAMRPVPLELPIASGVGRLLSEEESLVITLRPSEPAAIHAEVELSGGFPPTAADNFRQLVASLAQSTLGTALGLRSALGSLVVEATPTRVHLRADLDANELARGCAALFRAEIAEVLGDLPDAGAPTPSSDTSN